MRVLHVIATPRASKSNSLRVSAALLDCLRADRADVEVDSVDLFHQDLPALDGQNIDTKYHLLEGRSVDPRNADSWNRIEKLIEQFLAADLHVVSAPMWNFGIPYVLKYYIDAIVQPRYLFAYDEHGMPYGLCRNKKMVFLTTRGGDYSDGPMYAFDMQEPYLRAIFGFVGITDLQFINVQPTDMGPERAEVAIQDGIKRAEEIAAHLTSVWATPQADERGPAPASTIGDDAAVGANQA